MSITTKFWTRLQLIQKVERDLDLEGERFITPDEMRGYLEEAIDDVEKRTHTLYEDYFVASDTITLVSGTSKYALPANIFAHKIRAIIYRNGTRVYEVKRIREWKKFITYAMDRVYAGGSEDEYCYFLENTTAGQTKIVFSPSVAENGAYIEVWFLRQANRLDADTDALDVPEAASYVIQYMKVRCYEKEGHPNLGKAMQDLETERLQLDGTLQAMVPDGDNEIEPDLQIYREMN